ncbi:hypothetical protein TWF281_007660 [Arthrobotrys megalospora]
MAYNDFISELRKLSSPAEPFWLITKVLGGRRDSSADIRKVDLVEIPDEEGILKLQAWEHWKTGIACSTFRRSLRRPPRDGNTTTLLLVEDMSLEVVTFLCQELRVPPSFIHSHLMDGKGDLEWLNDEGRLYLRDNDRGSRSFSNAARTSKDTDTTFDEQDTSWKEKTYHFNASRRRDLFHKANLAFHLDWSWVSLVDASVSKEEQRLLETPGGNTPQAATKITRVPGILRKEEVVESESEHVIGLYNRIHRPHHAITTEKRGKWLAAAEERVSIIRIEVNGHKIVIYLFDPPRMLETSQNGIRGLFEGIAKRFGPKAGSGEDFEAVKTRIKTKDPRLSLQTTRDVFVDYLQYWNTNPRFSDFKVCEIDFLRGRLQEYCDTLTAIETSINDIDRSIPDEGTLQLNVNAWGKLLSSYRRILSEMLHSTRSQCQYLRNLERSTPNPMDATGEVMKSLSKDFSYALQEFGDSRQHVSDRVDRTFQALMSSMSIIESQEAISEASSVGKLTELAFIYIPVTFAATFYSMQIEASLPEPKV